MRRDWTTHVSGIRHRTLDREMPLCLCVWDNMTKKKLNTFKTSNAMIEMDNGGTLVKIKEERGLLEILIVISRSRP